MAGSNLERDQGTNPILMFFLPCMHLMVYACVLACMSYLTRYLIMRFTCSVSVSMAIWPRSPFKGALLSVESVEASVEV